jgi:hypothetical protein
VGLGLGKLLEPLHQSVGDGHAGELGIVATVGTGVGVATVSMCVSIREGYQGKGGGGGEGESRAIELTRGGKRE